MRQLDTCGLFCPVPILLTAREIKGMTAGQRLQVIGDDPGIVEDMPVWCEETGHALVSLDRDGERVVCVVEVRSTVPAS